MTVIGINEENHGLIGIAKDYPSAVNFLIVDEWLDEDFKFWPLEEKNFQLKKVKDIYGENWAEELKKLSEEEIDRLFDGSFYFKKIDVFGA